MTWEESLRAARARALKAARKNIGRVVPGAIGRGMLGVAAVTGAGAYVGHRVFSRDESALLQPPNGSGELGKSARATPRQRLVLAESSPRPNSHDALGEGSGSPANHMVRPFLRLILKQATGEEECCVFV